jgi:hypothetical protein
MGQNEIDVEIVTMMYEHILTTLIYQLWFTKIVYYNYPWVVGRKKSYQTSEHDVPEWNGSESKKRRENWAKIWNGCDCLSVNS